MVGFQRIAFRWICLCALLSFESSDWHLSSEGEGKKKERFITAMSGFGQDEVKAGRESEMIKGMAGLPRADTLPDLVGLGSLDERVEKWIPNEASYASGKNLGSTIMTASKVWWFEIRTDDRNNGFSEL
jgi:hypothetical protein